MLRTMMLGMMMLRAPEGEPNSGGAPAADDAAAKAKAEADAKAKAEADAKAKADAKSKADELERVKKEALDKAKAEGKQIPMASEASVQALNENLKKYLDRTEPKTGAAQKKKGDYFPW